MALPYSAHAQNRTTDAELLRLIPDAALENPEAWAKGDAPPAQPPASVTPSSVMPEAEIGPTSPLADMPELTLPWPDDAVALPALVSLEADADGVAAMADNGSETLTELPQGLVRTIAPGLSLVFPAENAAFPERAAFEERFRMLSALVTLGKGDQGNIAQIAVRARSDSELLQRLLRIYGYYDGDVVQTVKGIVPGQDVAQGDVQVSFDVVPGRQHHFGTVVLGDLPGTGVDYPTLRAAHGIGSGDPLLSDVMVSARDALDKALGENGYAFARVGAPELTVDHLREEGDLLQPVTAGGKYRFGQIISDQPRFMSGKHLSDIARFDSGDLYRRSQIDDLRRAILATGLVASVGVSPREVKAPTADAPGEVALDVTMARAPLRTIAGAIGYDSGDGFRLEGSWEHRNMFPPEGLLRLRGVAGTKEQLAGVTVRRNNFKGRDQVLTLDLYANQVSRTAYAARTVAMSATFEKLTTLIFQKPWTWSLGLEALATNESESAVQGVSTQRQTYFIGAAPMRAAFDGSDDLLDPHRGFRAGLRISPEVSSLSGSQSFYARIQGDVSAYLPATKNVVLAARARIGSIPGAAISNIAPSRRFYAGGGGSVRGFGYQLIGPRNTAGDPSGGRSLTEFSLEARVKTGIFGGALSIVPFVDAGGVDESSAPTLRNMRYGAGIGVRYQTGFGPIRIDLGTPLNHRTGESRIGLYVALGQAF